MPILTNPKHERFAQELAKGKSLEDAYVAAGYRPSRGNACVLKQKQSVSERVAELLAEREKIHAQATAEAIREEKLTKAWVIARLVENANRAMQAVPVTTRDGEATGEYKYEGHVANKALELLGKELGMFIDRHEVGGPGDFARMNDDELERFIAERAAVLNESHTAH